MSLPDTPDWTVATAAVQSRQVLYNLVYEYLDRDVERLNRTLWEHLRVTRRRASEVASWRIERAAGQPVVYIMGRTVHDDDQKYGAVEVATGMIRVWIADRREEPPREFTADCGNDGALLFTDADKYRNGALAGQPGDPGAGDPGVSFRRRRRCIRRHRKRESAASAVS